ncbi:MAG: F0F1 ATP synthase subunit gamma [Paludibacteraceae bacterium]|nr:F0F1 ATP synthase subunit gamma [Paludibacteraceae bacterium]MCR5567965.1 F0F1 ATP synthase subunit gamma [Paludibacteraceae bacterium]
MASLKEVKARIASVTSTQKITGAMKMVSSAKLKKAERAIESIEPYQNRLNGILNNFLKTETDYKSELADIRPVNRVAIVVFSSNSSLCGAFNSNVIKQLNAVLEEYKHLGKENIEIYPIGQKVYSAAVKMDLNVQGNFKSFADKPSFNAITENVTNVIVDKFVKKELDKIIVIYHHFKNTSSQILVSKTFLPISFESTAETDNGDDANKYAADYIVEPNKPAILEVLIPKAIKTKLYACLLDSNASEHAARVVAMQTANDNAESLISDLTILYNKTRQAAITSELLDIVGGAAALEN